MNSIPHVRFYWNVKEPRTTSVARIREEEGRLGVEAPVQETFYLFFFFFLLDGLSETVRMASERG